MLGSVKIIDKKDSFLSHEVCNFKCLNCGIIFKREYRYKHAKHKCSSFRITDEVKEKWCFKCKTWKVLDYFQKAKYVSGGYSKTCRTCRALYMGKAEKARHFKMNKTVMCLDRARGVINSAKTRARRKNIPFNINREYIYDLFNEQNGLCYFSSIKMKRECELNIYSPSLDRLDPEKGYIKGNIAWVINGINSFKQTLSANDFITLINSIKWRKDLV